MSRSASRARVGQSPRLAPRLKELRESGFSGRRVTQQQLAEALGGDRPLSIPSISAYENPFAPPPPETRLRDYATFFATERSLVDGRGRLVPDDELTRDERANRDALIEELLSLVDKPVGDASSAPREKTTAGQLIWSFPEGEPVRIICGQLEDMTHPYADPKNRNYTELLKFADLDALMELYAYAWRLNPSCDIRFMLDSRLRSSEDLQSHLVVLGGSGLNPSIQRIVTLTELPIRQQPKSKEVREGDIFDLGEGTERFLPKLDSDLGVVEDVGLFARLVNPYNSARTLTVCSGIFSRGVQGAVRMLTDASLRERNEDYLTNRFEDTAQFAVLMRVPVLFGQVVTPDLRNPSSRLFEWTP